LRERYGRQREEEGSGNKAQGVRLQHAESPETTAWLGYGASLCHDRLRAAFVEPLVPLEVGILATITPSRNP
jgi:hypothetical protein